MDGINKYSREWFALNGNEEYTSKAENLKDGVENTNGSANFKLDGSLFVGDKETVMNNIDDYCENFSNETAPIINNMQNFGAENIFNVLDANSDGIVTEEELADMAGASTPQSADTIDTYFSITDLKSFYKNAMAAEGAIVEEDGDTIKITYADGQYTELKTDENGNVYSRYYEKNYNGQRKGVEYNSKEDSTTISYKDSLHRPTKIIYEKEGKKFDYTTRYTYNDDGSKVVETETIGKKVITQYDSLGNTISENLELKYNSDGIIDDTKQQSNVGDCWLLSAVNALRVSEKGAEIIKNSIQQNNDGSVTVYLNGINTSYTYTPEDIGDYLDSNISTGDNDMDLIVMAVADFRRDRIESGTATKNRKNLETYVPSTATLEKPLEGGLVNEAIYYLTGIKSKYIEPFIKTEKKLEVLNEYLNSDKSNVAATISFKEKDETVHKKITTNHAYSIVGSDEQNVYVENPWKSGEIIAYPIDKIKENISSISLTYLNNEEKIEENMYSNGLSYLNNEDKNEEKWISEAEC